MIEDESRTVEATQASRHGTAEDGPTTAAGSADGAVGDPAAPVPAPRGPRLPWIVTAVAVVVAVVAVVVATILVNDARRPAADLEDVERSAGRFALDLTTWDASDGMADTREQLREAGTETFAADVDELFGGTDDLATLEELGARSEGEVRDVLVTSLDGDEAEALAVVVQRVTTDVTEGEEVSLRYARLGLRRDGGMWRVNEVELVVDALQEAASRTDLAPAGGGDPGDDTTTSEDAP